MILLLMYPGSWDHASSYEVWILSARSINVRGLESSVEVGA